MHRICDEKLDTDMRWWFYVTILIITILEILLKLAVVNKLNFILFLLIIVFSLSLFGLYDYILESLDRFFHNFKLQIVLILHFAKEYLFALYGFYQNIQFEYQNDKYTINVKLWIAILNEFYFLLFEFIILSLLPFYLYDKFKTKHQATS